VVKCQLRWGRGAEAALVALMVLLCGFGGGCGGKSGFLKKADRPKLSVEPNQLIEASGGVLAAEQSPGEGAELVKGQFEAADPAPPGVELVMPSGRPGWPSRVVFYENTSVAHEPLHMQGPFERYGGEDGYFRSWWLDDLASVVVSPAMLLANLAMTPVVAVAAPVWQKQYSRSVFGVDEEVYELPSEPSGMTRNERYNQPCPEQSHPVQAR